MLQRSDRNKQPAVSSPDYPTTPTTPRDAGFVSDYELEKQFSIEVSLLLVSGEPLGKISCDEQTTVGNIRQRVPQLLAEALSHGMTGEFHLVQNTRILRNDDLEILELCQSDVQELGETLRPPPLSRNFFSNYSFRG
jgi:hypothetical protein